MNSALSTVALSAYNVLAKCGEPSNVRKLHRLVSAGMNEAIDEDEFTRALAGLLELGYITIVCQADGLVDVVDPERRVVRWRDRSGEGWNNWMVDSIRGPQQLNEAIHHGVQ